MEELELYTTADLLAELQKRCERHVYIASEFPGSDSITILCKGTVFDAVALCEIGKYLVMKEGI